MCSDCYTDWLFPITLPFLKPPYSLRHNNIEVRLINTLQWSSDSQVKGRVTSLTSNQKLEMTKLREEDIKS